MEEAIESLRNGGVGIIATDTTYGLVGRALNKSAVNKIYQLKKRTPDKPFIILISDLNDLKLFRANITSNIRKHLDEYWPGPVSIIFECTDKGLEYLHRGTNTLAFRLPAKQDLLNVIKAAGPLVAPSANPESLPPANNIDEAKAYFGNQVDFYVEGQVNDKPSKIIRLTGDNEEVIRP